MCERMGEEKAICPSPEDLEFSGPVQCPFQGCGKQLPSSACLRMHVTRRHQGKPLEKLSVSHGAQPSFYCPEEGCKRSKEGGEPFSRLGQLKQHYQTMHGQKTHTCSKCDKKFALRDVCSRHEQECQEKIICTTCGLDFRSRNSLYQHAKRKGHPLPARNKLTLKKSSSLSVTSATNVILVPVPTSLKLVLPVPRVARLVSTATQTDRAASSRSGEPLSLVQQTVELQSSGSQTTPSLLSHTSFNHTLLLCPPSELHSLQGMHTPHSSLTQPLKGVTSLVVSTQTQPTQLCDFGTQTHLDSSHLPVAGVSSCYTQSSPALDLVEFGTQTPALSTPYAISESDTVDFGTQTIGMSELEMDDSLFSRNLLPPECLDFGTQTLDYPYDCSSPHSTHFCSHSTSVTRDQSSQTHT